MMPATTVTLAEAAAEVGISSTGVNMNISNLKTLSRVSHHFRAFLGYD